MSGGKPMTGRDRRNRNVLMVLVLVVAGMVGAAYAAVPLYRIFCAATGYRTEVSRLGFVAEALRLAMAPDGGMPALSPRFETRVKGLYTLGAMATGNFGPVLRFIVGSSYAAPRLAATLRQRVLWRRLSRTLY